MVAQSINITISGLTQPSSVKNISKFVVSIYYSNLNDLVAQATTTSVIATTPGTITVASVSPSSLVAAATNVIYSFTIKIANPLNIGSKVIISVPNTVTIVTGGTCTQQGSPVNCSVTIQTITITLSLAFQSLDTITFTYSNFNNPPNTRPSNRFDISTMNAAS